MNRLVIIGNGFDLAHGLPTSYKDFIQYLIGNILEDTLDNGSFEANGVLSAIWKGGYRQSGDNQVKRIIENIKTDRSALKDLLDNEEYIRVPGSALNFRNGNPFDFKIDNFFIKDLLNYSCKNWVDIEDFYYQSLLKLVKDNQVDDKIDELNKGLYFLKDKLEYYLSKITKGFNVGPDKTIHWRDRFLPEYWENSDNSNSNPKIERLLFLNFNYTSTISFYLSEFRDNVTAELINIHGQINSTWNPIIFGFGDEMDKNYQILEDANENRLLDHIKSFGYFENSNYKELTNFIESNLFQVQIAGHSCGLSDRIMLNMIFEHKNCQSIEVFYHEKKEGLDNYKILVQNISRHFRDKSAMRIKVLSKDMCQPMLEWNP